MEINEAIRKVKNIFPKIKIKEYCNYYDDEKLLYPENAKDGEADGKK